MTIFFADLQPETQEDIANDDVILLKNDALKPPLTPQHFDLLGGMKLAILFHGSNQHIIQQRFDTLLDHIAKKDDHFNAKIEHLSKLSDHFFKNHLWSNRLLPEEYNNEINQLSLTALVAQWAMRNNSGTRESTQAGGDMTANNGVSTSLSGGATG